MIVTKVFSFLLYSVLFLQSAYSQVPEKAEDISPLLIGEHIPDAALKDGEGKAVQLKNVLKQKPTVLVFYRGGWCPYCNRQLSGLVSIEEEIIQLGYQIVAISPDDYVNLKPTIEADKIQYQLYSDVDAQLIRNIGIAYKQADNAKAYVSAKTKGKVTDFLPAPTVMVVNRESEILFEYINPDFRKRIEPELLLAVLKALKK